MVICIILSTGLSHYYRGIKKYMMWDVCVPSTLYMDKYKYLLSKIIFQEFRIYPSNINGESGINIKKNKKHMFRNSCSNYELDDDYFLSLKNILKNDKPKNKDSLKTNYHKLKDKINYELYRITTVNNCLNLLENIHKLVLHKGRDKLIN